MLWPKLILAASLSGLNASDNAPTLAVVPSQPPVGRRVLIPTWELVVPVLSDSTPILEQNGPDSVVLMTEASESPRWLGTIRVVQLNAQSFASATQSYIDGLSLIHISEPTRPRLISYAVFCLKKKKK